MGGLKRTKQSSDNASLPLHDNILGGLAEELKDIGLRAVFIPAKGDLKSCVYVYSMFLNPHSGIRRIIITAYDHVIVVRPTCSHHKMAGRVNYEFSDPNSIQEIVKHIVNRIKFWEDMERISELEPQE